MGCIYSYKVSILRAIIHIRFLRHLAKEDKNMPGKNKHLTYDERVFIQQNLNKLSFKEIGKKLDKDCTSISREIRRHTITVYTGGLGKEYNSCAKRDRCPSSGMCGSKTCRRSSCCGCNVFCGSNCPNYEQDVCPLLEKPPYVCNGCSKRPRCKLPKTDYRAKEADNEYRVQLKELRSGVTISEEEARGLGEILQKGTKKGQSVHHIVFANGGEAAIGYSEKTIYNYIDAGVIPGVINLDLPRKVGYGKRKKSGDQYIKVDKACRIGRTYEDFLEFINTEENRYLPITQMDSVEGKKGVGEKVCLTIIFSTCSMMFGFLRDANTTESITSVFDSLKIKLGEDVFAKLFPIILTDRGTEFSDPKKIEMSLDGKRQLCHIFYCDPMNSNQKPEVERCHADFRRIVPKGTSLNGLSQDDIQKAFGNVAAIPRPQYNDKTSAQMFIAIYGEDIFKKLGGVYVTPKDANLTPRLLEK